MSKNYVELKVSELRDECKTRNLDTSGLKVHLVERLNKYDREQVIKSKTEVKPVIKTPVINEHATIDTKTETKLDTTEDKTSQLNKTENNDVIVKPSSVENNVKSVNVDDKASEKQVTKEDRKRPHHSDESSAAESKKESLFSLASKEIDNWESRTDVHLDFYNSDMNMVVDEPGFLGQPLYEDGFEYMTSGVKGNYGFKSGKVFYEVKILKKLKVSLNHDAGESNFLKIGWSTDIESLSLGEGVLSFAYDGIGKKTSGGNQSDYGIKFDEGDVVGCFLEFNGDCFIIRYSVNGNDQGEAFNTLSRELKDNVLMPHIYVKNVSFEVNFGQNENSAIFPPKTVIEGAEPVADVTWTLLGKVNLKQRTRALKPPKTKSECEVLMMCGLPSCGKTFWTENHIKEHQEKRYNLLSINTVLERMKIINLRKKVSNDRWDSFILSATQCLNKLMEIAVSRRRNFILDQTNVYATAQRRRMKPFEEFIRKAIIIVPTDDEYQRRMNQVIQEGKDVPESAVLQMKENFVIPEEKSDLFNEIIFIELQRVETEELIKKYNEEAKNKKKKESNASDSNKSKRDLDDDSYGKWASSPKASEDSEPTAPKKSRWNDQIDNKKDSKSRDRHDRASPDRAPRKNDYKGGFCFSREASDSGKGGSRSSDNGFRSDDRHNDRSRDQRGNKSNNTSYRRSGGDSGDRKPRFDSHEPKFGNRNPIGGGGNRDSRPRDRASDSRGGSQQFQGGRDRSRGGFNESRRPANSYEGASQDSSRNKFPPQPSYNDNRSGGMAGNYGSQDRGSRFGQQQNAAPPMTERGDYRGRGRGAPMGNQNASQRKDPTFNDRRGGEPDRRGAPPDREFQNYGEFDPYAESRQSNMPWQQDYKSEVMDTPRRASGYENTGGNQGRMNPVVGYDQQQQYGGSRPAVGGLTTARGLIDKPSNPYSDRKTQSTPTARGGAQANRGGESRFGGPFMDIPSSGEDNYSYGAAKNYEAPVSKFGTKQQAYPEMNQYKDQSARQDMSYSSASSTPSTAVPTSGPRGRGGFSRFGDAPAAAAKPVNPYDSNPKTDSASRSYSSTSQQHTNSYDSNPKADGASRSYSSTSQQHTNPYDSNPKTDGANRSYSSSSQQQTNPYDSNYQSYDNSQYGQNQGYYNYYTGDSASKEPSVGGHSSYSSLNSAPAAGRAAGGYQSANSTGYQSTHPPPSNPSSGTGYQSSNQAYSSSNAAGATGAYHHGSSYQSSNTATGGSYGGGSGSGYQSNYPTGGSGANATAAAAGNATSGGYQSSNYSYGGANTASSGTGGYQSSNYQSASSNPTSGTAAYQSSYQSSAASNPTSAGGFTNPYNAIYENSSSYNSSYYGQTNTYAQSGSYGDNSTTTQSKYGGGSADRSTAAASSNNPSSFSSSALSAPTSASVGQSQANWSAGGYGADYSQYYNQ